MARAIDDPFSAIIGQSAAILDQIELARMYALVDCSLTIFGENGTGKELFTRAIHEASPRAGRPLIALNCAGPTDELFENEMFGHEAGAYTSARTQTKGLIAAAEGGTLFLDEVDAPSINAQAKLLRFLQDKTYRPIGGTTLVRADVRIIAATNADLVQLIAGKTFREDLYFRLTVLPLRLPPLRDRLEDIPLLATFFLRKHGRRSADASGTPSPPSEGREVGSRLTSPMRHSFSPEAIAKLQAHHWPGNIRELENIVVRALVVSRGPVIEPKDLGFEIAGEACHGTLLERKRRASYEWEHREILKLLTANNGNIKKAAAASGLERRSFFERMREHGLTGNRRGKGP